MKTLTMASLLAMASGTAEAQQKYTPGVNSVTFKSDGETMVGNLYLPSGYKQGDKLPVVLIVGPFTQVKEQIPAKYSQKMIEGGLAAFGFDFRFWGESGGSPRSFESPKDKITDIKNAISFLETIDAIDKDRIGAIGVCFGAGYIAEVVSSDKRIKAWATVAAWLNDEDNLVKLFTKPTLDYRDSLSMVANKNYKETGKMEYAPAYEVGNKKAAMFFIVDYYGNPERGAIPQWKNEYAIISHKAWHDFNIWSSAPRITAPALFVHSDGSALPENVRRLHSTVKGPKELYWTEGEHTEFYDKEKQVNEASQALVRHFKKAL